MWNSTSNKQRYEVWKKLFELVASLEFSRKFTETFAKKFAEKWQ